MILGFKVAQTTAYFTDVVENELTFSAGNVEIKLVQNLTNWYGDAITTATPEDTTTSPTYDIDTFRLMPGKNYIKNPTVIVENGSSPSYIFVKIENGLKDIECKEPTIDQQLKTNHWHILDSENYPYVYYYDENQNTSSSGSYLVDASNDDVDINLLVFEDFTISEDAVLSNYTTIEPPKISVKAYAIQGKGFKTFNDAWTQINELSKD